MKTVNRDIVTSLQRIKRRLRDAFGPMQRFNHATH